MENAYKVLGLGKNASQDDVKKAYKKMAFKHHPDRNSGDSEAGEIFKDINSAYKFLKSNTVFQRENKKKEIVLGDDYGVFWGEPITQLEKSQGYKTLSIRDIFENRSRYGKDYPSWKEIFCTLDGNHVFKDGSHKIVLDDPFLKNLGRNYLEGYCGEVILSDEHWENLTGNNVLHLSKKRVESLQDELQSKETIKDSEFWNFILRNPKNIDEILDPIFSFSEMKGWGEKACDVYLNSSKDYHCALPLFLSSASNGSGVAAWPLSREIRFCRSQRKKP